MKNIFKICSCTPTPEVAYVGAPKCGLVLLKSQTLPAVWADAIHCACVDQFETDRARSSGMIKEYIQDETPLRTCAHARSGKTPATWRLSVCQTDPPISMST